MEAKNNFITLQHGSGGKLTRDLINKYFLKAFQNPILETLGDSAVLQLDGVHIAFTTDTFVVKPIFFPGGDIGHLAVCGTINDLSVIGAKPLAMSTGFVLEEGFPLSDLEQIIDSMQAAAKTAEVLIVTGDTKVVERGGADGLFINTSGIGIIEPGLVSPDPPKSGDKIIINGTLGDHGIAVLSAREDLPLETDIESDSACLNLLIFPVLERFPGKVKFMRDLTRGGFATILNEVIQGKDFGVQVFEDRIPIKEAVRSICEILGFDPLYIANEGKAAFIVEDGVSKEIVDFMKTIPLGSEASEVGEITSAHPGKVVLKTKIGGGRILDMLVGDQLPRIC